MSTFPLQLKCQHSAEALKGLVGRI